MEKVSDAAKKIMQSTSSLSSVASRQHQPSPERRDDMFVMECTPRNTDLSFTPD